MMLNDIIYLSQHWFRQWLVAYSTPIHYLNQFCLLDWSDYSSVGYLAQLITLINRLRPRQNGHHFPDDIFKWIFLNENVSISMDISLKFVSNGPINNIPSLVQIMAWRRPGDKPLSEPMMVSSPTHICVTICVTQPQWDKVIVVF